MEKICLLLDDNELEGTISAYNDKLKSGDTVHYERIEPQVDGKLMSPSLEKTVSYILHRCKQETISLLACDMYLGNGLKGLDVAREVLKQRQHLPVILYSGDFESVAEDIRDKLNDKNTNPREHLRALTRIKDYVDRAEQLDERILYFLNKDDSIFTQVSAKLMEYPDVTLKHGYEHYLGWQLHAIASEVINESSPHGAKFAHEIISRAISHLIDLNK